MYVLYIVDETSCVIDPNLIKVRLNIVKILTFVYLGKVTDAKGSENFITAIKLCIFPPSNKKSTENVHVQQCV